LDERATTAFHRPDILVVDDTPANLDLLMAMLQGRGYRASARLVFPAPAGPTSAITRVPLATAPLGMRLSFVRCAGASRVKRGTRTSKRTASDSLAAKARGVVTRSQQLAEHFS
jgi:hypothetical protein